MAEDYSLFVGIPEPVQARKSTLECAKEIIRQLQRYEELKPIREEKVKLTLELRHIFEEIDKLNTDLKAQFPKAGLKLPERIPIQETKKQAKNKISKKELNEIEKLEQELSFIEGRLNKLS
ncbi:hypothetical protein HYV81_00380 [Candidatus Woesearchaeota archaeon]|nr:hypothetical protein [Candidatus Woesearchaeota archaeon]